MTLRTRTDVLLLAGFCAFLFFYGLGQFGLIGADEPRYAQVAREMLDRHDWITPTLDRRPWLEKPPLFYWQAMIAYSVAGVSDVAARFPSVIDATLLVIAVYLFFRRFRRGGEIDAALITASSAGVIGFARAASMDMALAATLGIAMLGWWAWRESGKKIYLLLFYFFAALGMLAKGPVAPLLAAIIIVAYVALAKEWRRIIETLWPPGVLLFCAVALPWYIAVQMRNPQFFREFILEHNLARFSTDLYHHREPFWYYVPVLALALMPWIVFVVAAFVRAVRTWVWKGDAKPAESDLGLHFNLFACCWLIAPLVFFSISQSKLPGYILPAVPAGAMLVAGYIRELSDEQHSVSKLLAVLHAIVAAAPIVPAVLVAYAVTQHRLPAGRPMIFALVIAFLLCAAIALTLVSGRGLRMLRFVTLIPVVLTVAAVLKLGAVSLDQTLSARPLAFELVSIETHRLPIAVCGTSRELEFGLGFYRNQTVARYESGNVPAGEHFLVAAPAWRKNVAEQTAGRRISLLGHYAAQNLDYYWVSGAGAKQ
jgi:4-amino-4-deoxy-L-arabinose transferase-like glycosyltransferase